jgi:hypothetical protein
VAALKWNGWQHSSGIGGSFEPEYASQVILAQGGDAAFITRSIHSNPHFLARFEVNSYFSR